MSTLYDLGEEFAEAREAIDAELAENGGEWTDAMAERLDAVEMAWSDKVERVALYARGLDLTIAAVKAELRRLKARGRALAKERKWYRETYLPHALAKQGRTEMKGALATVRIGKNPPAVHCTVPLTSLPTRFLRFKVAPIELDKPEILKADKGGEVLPDGVWVERATVARIT